MATVELRKVRKKFGDHEVIHGIDLLIKDHEFIAFVGPSGCGKSTLLRMIAGLEEVTEGEVLIDGSPAQDVPPSKRGLAMVFQSYALYPHMTVAENMSFSLRLAGVLESGARAEGPRRRTHPGNGASARTKAQPAFRRPIAARGHWPRHGPTTEGLPDG